MQQREYYLVGFATNEIEESSPPTVRRLLQNMFFQHYNNGMTVRKSAEFVIKSYLHVWQKFQIEIKEDHKLIAKLEREFDQWRKIVSKKLSITPKQIEIRQQFSDHLDSEFDAKKGDPKMSQECEPQIQESEEEEEEMSMSPEMMDIQCEQDDQPGAASLEVVRSKRSKSVEASEKLKEHAAHKRPRYEVESDESSASSSLSASQIEPDSSPYQSPGPSSPRPPKKHFITDELLAMLDGMALSDRVAFQVICGVAKALGFNVIDDLVISYNTLRRERTKYRQKTALKIKDAFKVSFFMTCLFLNYEKIY